MFFIFSALGGRVGRRDVNSLRNGCPEQSGMCANSPSTPVSEAPPRAIPDASKGFPKAWQESVTKLTSALPLGSSSGAGECLWCHLQVIVDGVNQDLVQNPGAVRPLSFLRFGAENISFPTMSGCFLPRPGLGPHPRGGQEVLLLCSGPWLLHIASAKATVTRQPGLCF